MNLRRSFCHSLVYYEGKLLVFNLLKNFIKKKSKGRKYNSKGRKYFGVYFKFIKIFLLVNKIFGKYQKFNKWNNEIWKKKEKTRIRICNSKFNLK